MNLIEFIEKVYESFKAMERREMVFHHKSRMHSFGEFILRSLANPDCDGSEDVLFGISSERKKQQAEKQIKDQFYDIESVQNFYGER